MIVDIKLPEQPPLYDQLVAAGCTVDHHESDLYVLDTPEARRVLAAFHAPMAAISKSTHETVSQVRTFKSEKDGRIWFDLPFMYSPFWQAKQRRG